MKKTAGFLSTAFLGAGMAVASPAFAGDTESFVQAFTRQEREEMGRSVELRECLSNVTLAQIFGKVTPEAAASAAIQCEQQTEYTRHQMDEFFHALRVKHGSDKVNEFILMPLGEQMFLLAPGPR